MFASSLYISPSTLSIRSNAVASDSYGGDTIQSLGTGLSGTVAGIRLYISCLSNCASGRFKAYLMENSSISYSSLTHISAHSFGVMSVPINTQTLFIGSTTPFSLNPGSFYSIRLTYDNGGNDFHVYGSSSDNYANGTTTASLGFSGGDIYFDLFDSGGSTITGSGATRIINQLPAVGEIFRSNLASFSVQYYDSNVFYNTLGVAIQDTTDNQELSPLETTSISLGSDTTVSFSTNLIMGHSYTYVPYLRNSASSVYSTTTVFGLSSPFTLSTSSPDLFTEATFASTTATSSPFFRFLNVPYILSTKVPFSWIFQIALLLNNTSNIASTTIPSGTISVPLHVNGATTTTISADLFSENTVRTYVPQNTLDVLRALMVAVVYISMGMYIFRRLTHLT